jgi:hypothetical protein
VLLLGQTADFSGPQAAPVKETVAAARAYFDHVNAQGGVNGRKIVLESLDDGFDTKRSVENAKKLTSSFAEKPGTDHGFPSGRKPGSVPGFHAAWSMTSCNELVPWNSLTSRR